MKDPIIPPVLNKGAKTILFVDDELSILSALRRLFIDEEWDLYFAASGAEALAIMEQTAVDLVISDFLMPEMDGAELLRAVRDRYPSTIRLMLTGYITREAVGRTLAEGSAQQLFAKPWKEAELKGAVRAALLQSEQLRSISPGLQKIINTLNSLPELPVRYHDINRLLGELPEISMERLSAAIEKDVSLTADLLRWANSALFGQMQKVDTVKRAIVVIGVEVVKGLILARTLSEVLLKHADPGWGSAIESHQQHSMTCAVIARLLAGYLAPAAAAALADQAFTAGLLHDLGVLVEIGHLPTEFQTISQTVRQDGMSLLAGEELILHTNHAEIGGYLAAWWSLPGYLVSAIRWHHAPSQARGLEQELIAIIHVADCLAHDPALRGSDQPWQCPRPPRDEAVWARFALADEWLEEIADRLRESIG